MKKSYLLLALLVLGSAKLVAQKLPKVQEGGLFAPTDVKIDGKANEWAFKAFNNSTSVFYTIANDDKNIYLVVKTTNWVAIAKLLVGGLVMRIGNKESAVAITYPKLNNNIGGSIASRVRNDEAKVFSMVVVDSLNSKFDLNEKEIGITGVTDFPDNVVSVYNTQDIKASGKVDESKAFTIELKIPISYLRPAFKETNKFEYNITLKSIMNNPGAGMGTVNGQVKPINSADLSERLSRMPATPQVMQMRDMTTATDFSGVYVMASK